MADLTPKAHRTWRIELPVDPFRVVSGFLPIAHADGKGFAVESRGAGLALDTDGDGQVDRILEGVLDPDTNVRSARATLSGRTAGGQAFTYPVRFENTGGVWKWATGGVLEGQLGETPIQLIDLDGNGRYGDVGTDAIVVGHGDVAQFFGETLHVDGQLMRVAFDAAGQRLASEAFDGPTGKLDVRSELAAKGVLLAAVVASEDGKHSFELAAEGLTSQVSVPAGRYRVVRACLGLGEARVAADPSAMKSIEVAGGAEAVLAWGAPIVATFGVEQRGDELILDPAAVRYVGRGGERWIGWDPIGKSPSFRLKEKDTGDVLVDVVFPGSC